MSWMKKPHTARRDKRREGNVFASAKFQKCAYFFHRGTEVADVRNFALVERAGNYEAVCGIRLKQSGPEIRP